MSTDTITAGSVVRVVDFVSQPWAADEIEYARAENSLIVHGYVGKMGRVQRVDADPTPYIVEFFDAYRAPIAVMRFHRGEVEDVG